MRRYLLKRGGGALVTVFLASVVVFVGVHLLPGDPALTLAGQEGANDPELLAAIRESYSLDEPLPTQYVSWLGHVVRGDFGTSTQTAEPVGDMVIRRIPITLELAALSLLFAVVIGVPVGTLAALRQGKLTDFVCNVAGFVGISVPGFWVGLILIAVLAVELHILPASGFVSFSQDPVANLEHLVMPAVVLGIGFAAVVMVQTRSSMIETLNLDFIRTARAKGISNAAVVIRHALRNSVLTVVTILGLQLGVLIGGSVVTEQIFLIPGFGKLIVEAVNTRDYPVIQAVALLTAVGYIVVNLVVDVLYTILDPRVRLAGAGHD